MVYYQSSETKPDNCPPTGQSFPTRPSSLHHIEFMQPNPCIYHQTCKRLYEPHLHHRSLPLSSRHPTSKYQSILLHITTIFYIHNANRHRHRCNRYVSNDSIHHIILTIEIFRHPRPRNNHSPFQTSRLDKHLRPLPQHEGYLPSTSPPRQHRPPRLTQRPSQSTLFPKCFRRLPLLHRIPPRRRRKEPRTNQRRHARELSKGAKH